MRDQDLYSYIALLCFCLGGCSGLKSAQWPDWMADCQLPRDAVIQTLDKRLTDAMYDLSVAGTCNNGAYDDFTGCPEYHREWREYWRLRRKYDACIGEGMRT